MHLRVDGSGDEAVGEGSERVWAAADDVRADHLKLAIGDLAEDEDAALRRLLLGRKDVGSTNDKLFDAADRKNGDALTFLLRLEGYVGEHCDMRGVSSKTRKETDLTHLRRTDRRTP